MTGRSARVIDGHDVRVRADATRCQALGVETSQLTLVEAVRLQDLEGYRAIESRVQGTVDNREATLVDPGEVLVAVRGVVHRLGERPCLAAAARFALARRHTHPFRWPPLRQRDLTKFVTAEGPARRVCRGLWKDPGMTAQILDGKATLATIKDELRGRIAALAAQGIVPGLGTVRVGEDPGTRWYVNAKHKDCAEVGIASIRHDLPTGATQSEVEAVVDQLNADPACTGYLVQQPTGLDEFALLSRVDPVKDVDGLHPYNLGCLVLGQAAPLPCTPVGIIELLRRYGVPIAGAHVVVVGRGLTVGRPLGLLLTRRSENATVTLCHTGTRDLAGHVAQADIVVAAAGMAGIIRADMVKPGAAVVDVGVSREVGEAGRSRVVGDVHPDVAEVAGWLTPNPGGVGPMTRAMLLTNVVEAAERAAGM